jgi:hypothetical protein
MTSEQALINRTSLKSYIKDIDLSSVADIEAKLKIDYLKKNVLSYFKCLRYMNVLSYDRMSSNN